MRLLLFPVLLMLTIAAVPAVHAQDSIHRCVDPAGRPVFTDRRCSALDATPVLPAVAATVSHPAVGASTDDAARLCAADPAELRRQVVDAFAQHQANRLAGLMLWDDYGERGAVDRIQALGTLVDRPLLDLRNDDADSGEGWTARAGPSPSIYDASRPLRDQLDDRAAASLPSANMPDPQALVAVTPGADGLPQDTRFTVERRAGCLWLLPPAD